MLPRGMPERLRVRIRRQKREVRGPPLQAGLKGVVSGIANVHLVAVAGESVPERTARPDNQAAIRPGICAVLPIRPTLRGACLYPGASQTEAAVGFAGLPGMGKINGKCTP